MRTIAAIALAAACLFPARAQYQDAAVLLQYLTGDADAADEYRALVDAFATAPDEAIERMLAMPADAVSRAVHDAARKDSDWSAEALDRALLMHGDAIVVLAAKNSPMATDHIGVASELAFAAAERTGNEWFVHRWYTAVTARVRNTMLDAQWRKQPWYHAAAAVDRARELETNGGQETQPLDTTVYDPSAFKQAMPLFEQGVAARLPVAALHLGRIQMLRGRDSEARRLFSLAAEDGTSRVNRYLAHLFLGSLEERDSIFDAAEDHYRRALVALPRAQSGRFALAALLARTARDAEARLAIVDRGAPPFYDPWWSYFHGTARENEYILAELHSEVCR